MISAQIHFNHPSNQDINIKNHDTPYVNVLIGWLKVDWMAKVHLRRYNCPLLVVRIIVMRKTLVFAPVQELPLLWKSAKGSHPSQVSDEIKEFDSTFINRTCTKYQKISKHIHRYIYNKTEKKKQRETDHTRIQSWSYANRERAPLVWKLDHQCGSKYALLMCFV